MSPCPDESLVLQYLGGRARDQAAALEAHVDGCGTCRAWIAGLARTSLGLAGSEPSAEDAAVDLGEFLPVGAMVGRYRITAVLGRGGMGVVYEAHDPELRRRVALKVLRAVIASSEAPRLLAEARTMAKLSHPNVCPVFDVGAVGERWFLAMALVDGGTLARWLTPPRSSAAIVSMFAQAGRGVAAAHRVGIVHRDFKPSNVLVDGADRALVCDFGLASTDRDPTGPTGGTPRYMPPEQRDGGGDARVDQFAFGVALRDALGDRTVTARLRAAIARATADVPEHRFVDMDALVAEIEQGSARRPWLPVAAALGIGATAAIAVALAGDARPSSDATAAGAPAVSAPVQALIDLGKERDGQSDPAGSVTALDDAVALAESAGDRPGLALAWATRGAQLGNTARAPEAADELERAFNLAIELRRTDIAVEAATVRVGLLAEDLGRDDDALVWSRHVEAELARETSIDPGLLADFDTVMGRLHYHRNELDLAHARYEAAIGRLRSDRPRLDVRLGSALALMGLVEVALGDLPAAHAAMTESVAIAEDVYGPDHPELGGILGNFATVAAEMDRFDEARELLERAKAIIVAAYGVRHPNALAIEAGIAALWIRTGEYQSARACLERALANAPPTLPITCDLRERLGYTLGQLDRSADAIVELERADSCFAGYSGHDGPDVARIRDDIAELRAAAASAAARPSGVTPGAEPM